MLIRNRIGKLQNIQEVDTLGLGLCLANGIAWTLAMVLSLATCGASSPSQVNPALISMGVGSVSPCCDQDFSLFSFSVRTINAAKAKGFLAK